MGCLSVGRLVPPSVWRRRRQPISRLYCPTLYLGVGETFGAARQLPLPNAFSSAQPDGKAASARLGGGHLAARVPRGRLVGINKFSCKLRAVYLILSAAPRSGLAPWRRRPAGLLRARTPRLAWRISLAGGSRERYSSSLGAPLAAAAAKAAAVRGRAIISRDRRARARSRLLRGASCSLRAGRTKT